VGLRMGSMERAPSCWVEPWKVGQEAVISVVEVVSGSRSVAVETGWVQAGSTMRRQSESRL
jgi:hypothetical protein